MKHSAHYRKLKWTAFFLTVALLSSAFIIVYLSEKPQSTPIQNDESNLQIEPLHGSLSNESFAALIEENLSELNFMKEITFQGTEEGQFLIAGTFSNPSRLVAICKDLKPFEAILNTLKGSSVSITGHLGADENGNGRFISDIITCSGFKVPAGIATDYIDQYTGLNDLLEVPVEEISISEEGITFSEELPDFIQTALYK